MQTDVKTLVGLVGQQAIKIHLLEIQLEEAQQQMAKLTDSADVRLGYLAEIALGRLKPNQIEVNMSAKTLTILEAKEGQ